MQGHLQAHRRLLIVAYRRYLAADRALQIARSAAVSWFPVAPSRNTMPIGDPGSRIRRLYEHRDRALARLTLARQALEEAENRMRERRRRTEFVVVALS
jgi:hypothetical protein